VAKSPDGVLLVLARRGCLKRLYEAYCLNSGFRGRCNGSRRRANPSPIPGSTIVLGDVWYTVAVYQDDCGRGRLRVAVYRNIEAVDDVSSYLPDEVRRLLREADLLEE